eukprot:SAG31_NODE_8966_length_1355_cov_2.503185_1_plen_179_part_00
MDRFECEFCHAATQPPRSSSELLQSYFPRSPSGSSARRAVRVHHPGITLLQVAHPGPRRPRPRAAFAMALLFVVVFVVATATGLAAAPTAQVPTVTIAHGVDIPMVALGTGSGQKGDVERCGPPLLCSGRSKAASSSLVVLTRRASPCSAVALWLGSAGGVGASATAPSQQTHERAEQ